MIIPLFYPGELDRAKGVILHNLPSADQVEIADHAKYLGVLVGPGAVDEFWKAPILKMLKVVDKWYRLHLGLHWTAAVCTVIAVPALHFYLQ